MQQINFIEEEPLAAVIRGKIAGNDIHRILVDTGASKTVIRKQWVPNAAMTGKRLRFAALSGPLQVLPLAVVTLEIDGQKLELEVAVSDNLSRSSYRIYGLGGGKLKTFGVYVMGVHKQAPSWGVWGCPLPPDFFLQNRCSQIDSDTVASCHRI